MFVQTKIESGVYHICLQGVDDNVLQQSLLENLNMHLEKANDDALCRVILISAKGKYFCSGLQLECLQTAHKVETLKKLLYCLQLIYTSQKATVVFVDGAVIGGGVGLVAAADIVMATQQATFQLSEVVVGMIPAMIAPFILRRTSLGKLRYLTLSSQKISAEETQKIGLVDEIVHNQEQVEEQLQRLLYSNPQAIAESKLLFEMLVDKSLEKEKELAFSVLKKWLEQEEILAEIQDFAEGLSPSWFQKYRGDLL